MHISWLFSNANVHLQHSNAEKYDLKKQGVCICIDRVALAFLYIGVGASPSIDHWCKSKNIASLTNQYVNLLNKTIT